MWQEPSTKLPCLWNVSLHCTRFFLWNFLITGIVFIRQTQECKARQSRLSSPPASPVEVMKSENFLFSLLSHDVCATCGRWPSLWEPKFNIQPQLKSLGKIMQEHEWFPRLSRKCKRTPKVTKDYASLSKIMYNIQELGVYFNWGHTSLVCFAWIHHRPS